MLEWLFDGWWSSPWDFTDTLTQALYLRLLLDERFDFHGSATPAFTKVSAWSSLSMAVSRRSLSEVGLWGTPAGLSRILVSWRLPNRWRDAQEDRFRGAVPGSPWVLA